MMKMLKEENRGVANILTFSLIPLAGFATDIYIPSLPSMALDLHASPAQIQLSLLVFMVSGGVGQLFAGSVLDSFGRYKLSNASLLIFSIASFLIGLFPNLYLLYFLRVVQGVTTAFILVAKRAYFMDLYSGTQLKNYVSLFSIIWATAPIIAPFLGGYLQHVFGWEANFYFLGTLTSVILLLTLRYGGETLKNPRPFQAKPLLRVYKNVLATKDFNLALLISGLSYGMVMLFGMVSPFIIEHSWHQSAMVTGYCALLSGVSMMCGGIISKSMIKKPLEKKIPGALGIQMSSAILATIISLMSTTNIYVMMSFVIIQHVIVGFVFNNLYAYSLGRFSQNAGIVSGLTGAALYIISSLSSYGTAGLLTVKSPTLVPLAYAFLNACIVVSYLLFRREEMTATKKLGFELS
jgi:MFS family permease